MGKVVLCLDLWSCWIQFKKVIYYLLVAYVILDSEGIHLLIPSCQDWGSNSQLVAGLRIKVERLVLNKSLEYSVVITNDI